MDLINMYRHSRYPKISSIKPGDMVYIQNLHYSMSQMKLIEEFEQIRIVYAFAGCEGCMSSCNTKGTYIAGHSMQWDADPDDMVKLCSRMLFDDHKNLFIE